MSELVDVLPPYKSPNTENFKWGEKDAAEFYRDLDVAYREVVQWRRNIFMVPLGKIGEQFIQELSSLYHSYGNSDARETVALTAVITMPTLLLQKPHRKSTISEHVQVLARRIEEWKKGNLCPCERRPMYPTENHK